MISPEWYIPATLCVLVLSILLGIGGANGGWSSDQGGTDDPNIRNGQFYCEADREGSLVRQPAGTVSSLFFFLASFCIALRSSRLRRQRLAFRSNSTDIAAVGSTNLMTSTTFFPTLYTSSVALIGTGSTALHITLKRWGGILDVVSIVSFVLILFLYALARWLDGHQYSTLKKPRRFCVVLLAVGGALGAVSFGVDSFVGDTLLLWVVFVPICLAFLCLEVQIYRKAEKHFDIGWFVGALACFGIGTTLNALSDSDGILCDSPTSWFQGHALWHTFAAIATVMNYFYLASEHTPQERSEINEDVIDPSEANPRETQFLEHSEDSPDEKCTHTSNSKTWN